ncbi:DUF5069 domain-containing protein [Luteolibacter yonseiensis]|uniref:DUF5069 domain-containing protein n=1 Tax=Luteolibacter yonseiensis TaxID=1144680 RepID=A0A934VAC8_9BACT|nr:DUF5069 domain-containing protein [Luteolibacter yonseiensis]MBK1814731.1 DUF5069 domain-containing protein [Luteolibacter yonseiensis]
MVLPRPTDRLVDCVWLPRILAKARLLAVDELPEEYASRFCHPSGVDGQFIAFFNLTRDELPAVCGRGDGEIGEWFLSSPERKSRIQEWNRIAVNLGRAGFPMAERLPVALSTSYRHLADRKLETVFQVLEADEEGGPELTPPAGP